MIGRICKMGRLFLPLAALLWVAPLMAQSGSGNVREASCAEFSADSADAAYLAYIAGYADSSSPDPDYLQSPAALSRINDAVRDWCSKRPKRDFTTAVAAVVGAPQPAYAPAPAMVTARPTQCSVGPTQACSGCSISCSAGTQATCKQGTDYGGGNDCAFQSSCTCKR